VAECVRAPDVPVNVSVALPVVAPATAVRVTVWAVPGIRVRVAGDAVTPVGRPLRVTATALEKPFAPVASKLIFVVPPTLSVAVAGVADSEKSGSGVGAATESTNVTVWLIDPEVPVIVIVALPGVAFDAAVSVIDCDAPILRVNAAVEAVTPFDNPVTATPIVPFDPATALADTVTVAVDPGEMVTVLALVVSVKSGLPEPLPHAVSKARNAEHTTTRRRGNPGIDNLTVNLGCASAAVSRHASRSSARAARHYLG
jgi:hypothetical protein